MNDDKSFWKNDNPAHCLPPTPCCGWIVQSWSAADAWGDGKPCRSFLQYYLEYWDVIAPDLIDFFQIRMKEGQRVSVCEREMPCEVNKKYFMHVFISLALPFSQSAHFTPQDYSGG